jgi:spermidine/putrescine transport system ATP-binding protein
VSNLLDAEVAARGERFAELRLADGTMLRAPSAALDGETKVRLGVRPEKLRVLAIGEDDLEPRNEGETNAIAGVVLDASYIGVSTQYLVETPDKHRLVVYAQNLETSGAGEVLGDGQRVRLTWKPQHTFVIARSVGPAPDANGEEREEQQSDA